MPSLVIPPKNDQADEDRWSDSQATTEEAAKAEAANDKVIKEAGAGGAIYDVSSARFTKLSSTMPLPVIPPENEEAAKADAAKAEAPKADAAKEAEAKEEATKVDATKADAAKKAAAKKVAAKEEAAKKAEAKRTQLKRKQLERKRSVEQQRLREKHSKERRVMWMDRAQLLTRRTQPKRKRSVE
ncbi:MAG: hypothetical protein Q9204_005750 [Flavoplaca sp. TL-2023a]